MKKDSDDSMAILCFFKKIISSQNKFGLKKYLLCFINFDLIQPHSIRLDFIVYFFIVNMHLPLRKVSTNNLHVTQSWFYLFVVNSHFNCWVVDLVKETDLRTIIDRTIYILWEHLNDGQLTGSNGTQELVTSI